VNVKKREASAAHPDRQQQFELLESQKHVFQAAGWPIISVDTKKKELIGNFKNAGQAWGQKAEAVNVHDFPHDASMRAVPYGIYERVQQLWLGLCGLLRRYPGVCCGRSCPLVGRGGATAISPRYTALDPGRYRRQ